MLWLVKRTIVLSAALILCVGCGTSSSTDIPNPNDPSGTGAPITPGVTQTAKDGIPDLTGSARVLIGQIEPPHPELEEIFGTVHGEIVGVPRIKLALRNQSGTSLEGGFLFGFEDEKFWRDRRQASFPGTGKLEANKLQIIFQDDQFVFLVEADRQGDQLSNGTIKYRVHQASDLQCRIVTYYCGSAPCPTQPPQNSAACTQYMTAGGANVKTLGTFPSANLRDWVFQ